MKTESTFNARLAGAGLVAGVGVAQASLLVDGAFDGTWMLAAFMTVGLGVLLIAVFDRLDGRSIPPAAPSGDEGAGASEDAAEEDDESTEPRLRVFVISSLMQGVSLAFIAGYFSGSIVVAVMIGLLVGTMALAVSTLLARKLASLPEA